MEPRLSSDSPSEFEGQPPPLEATLPADLPPLDLEDSDDEDESAVVGHADPDADVDLDSEPLEHQLPPEIDPAMTFADMKLIRPLFDAITHAGYVHPTPVQEAVIPLAMRGKDVIGQAQTGTGKDRKSVV